jgi:glycosyltransferase involved in cell wall biosynthesis
MLEEGMPDDRLYVVRNGIDTSHFRPHDRSFHRDRCTIGSVSVLRPEKGLPTLIQGFHLAQAKFPGMRLVIVGAGPERESLERQVIAAGLSDRVEFAGAAADVLPWLHQIDVFVLPSFSEALSNSLMEAMACSCCCVASDVGGNPELIADGVTGRLFRAGDVEQLGELLVSLASDVSTRRALARGAADRISGEFNAQRGAEALAHCYESALARRGSPVARLAPRGPRD